MEAIRTEFRKTTYSGRPVRLHTCSVCGKEDTWNTTNWQWYGSYENADNDEPVYKTCSAECAEKMQQWLLKGGGKW